MRKIKQGMIENTKVEFDKNQGGLIRINGDYDKHRGV